MDLKKKMIIVSASVIAILGVILVGVAYYNYTKKINDTQQEITKVIEQSIQSYMKEYAGTAANMEELQSEVKTLTKNPNNSSTTLTDAQVNAIIKSTTERVESGILREVTSQLFSLKQETLSELETQIDAKIREVLSEVSEESMLSDEEISEISNSVQLIVESNILSAVRDQYKVLAKSVSVLEASINKKIEVINSTLMDYETRIQDLENTAASNESLNALKGQYSNFVKTALVTTNIISDISVMPTDKNGVVSARAGYKMNGKIEALQKDLSTKYESLLASIEEINKQLDDNLKKMEDATATKEAVNKAIKALQDADASNVSSIDQAKTLLEEAIAAAKNDVSSDA